MPTIATSEHPSRFQDRLVWGLSIAAQVIWAITVVVVWLMPAPVKDCSLSSMPFWFAVTLFAVFSALPAACLLGVRCWAIKPLSESISLKLFEGAFSSLLGFALALVWPMALGHGDDSIYPVIVSLTMVISLGKYASAMWEALNRMP